MSRYEALAASYDRLTEDVPYGEMLSFVESLLRDVGKKPETVLDLGCGSGSMARLLAEKGYRVLGVDLSEDMLTEAWSKCMELENPPLFIRQSMAELELPEPVDFVYSGLDSIDYLTEPRDCQETFRRVYENLVPGGTFIFDVNTPEKLHAMDGQIFLDEDEDVYCVWRGSFSEEENILYYGMDLFQRRGKSWLRSFEEHLEYAYTIPQLQSYLEKAGFRQIQVFGDRSLEAPKPGEQRVYFRAIKERQ